LNANEEVLIDVDRLAKKYDNFALAPLELNPEQDILAYGVDTTGNRNIWTIYFQDLKTGELFPEFIPEVHHLTAWANDNMTFFYVRKNQVYSHLLGTDPSEDRFLLEHIRYLYKCKSAKYILMFSDFGPWQWKGYLDADISMGHFNEIKPSKQNYKCFRLDHSGDKFYFLNNGLMEIPVGSRKLEDASTIFSPPEDVNIDHLEVFKDHLVLKEKKNGLPQLHIVSLKDGKEHFVDFAELVYSVSVSRVGGFELGSLSNAEFNSPILRYRYTSLTTPKSIYDYNMVTRERVLVGQEKVANGFDPSNYQSERLWAKAEDGTQIPISVVYRKEIKKDARNPLLLDGYGMWGVSEEPRFVGTSLSLLDRGFILATAHVRGGAELVGWHEEGKLLKKRNSFTDFVACAQYLIRERYTDSERLFASGISGGGLLMAGVITLAPELFKGVIIKVPEVDIITRMLEDNVFYDELGDPNIKEYYEYMLSYAPYDNIEAREYPNILITAGFFDTRVHYWQPAKLAAKLRAKRSDQNLLLLKTHITGGHGGAIFSGRIKRFQEKAYEYAFLLDLAGIRE
jgi:oligopeptidase B